MNIDLNVLDFGLLLPVAYVLLACICRLNMMEPGSSGWAWRVVYVVLAAWTGDVAADLATLGNVPLRDALGVVAMAAYMHMTRLRWADGVPEIARRNRIGNSAFGGFDNAR